MNQHPRHWLWLLLALPIGLGLWRLRFDVEVLNLLPPQSTAVQGVRLFQEHFANARQLIVTVQAGTAADAETAARALAETLRRAPQLVSSAHWQPPWQEHPGQAAELIAFLWLNQPPDAFGPLTNRLTGPAIQTALSEAREQLATSLSPESLARRGYDPFNLGQLPGTPQSGFTALGSLGAGGDFFASADGTFRVVFVEAAGDLSGYQPCIAWLNQIRGLVESIRGVPDFPRGIEVGYTGRPAFVAEIAGGMQSDFAGPSTITLAVIAVLFYLAHRRWRPLLWLVTLLAAILAATLALGGLAYGALNVVSLGFASILLGLAEDFGIVLYQESRSHPDAAVSAIRQLATPGIVWSAITTAGAFLLLNLSTLPGLRQMGTLVAIGIAVAAVVMLFAFLPPLIRKGDVQGMASTSPKGAAPAAPTASVLRRGPISLSLMISLATLVLLWVRPPIFDASTETLRPKHSDAYATLAVMKRQLGRTQDPWWVLVPGNDEGEVARKLQALQPALAAAQTAGQLRDFTLPSQLWPNPAHQSANRAALAAVLPRLGALRLAAEAAGFTSNSLALTEGLFAAWGRAAAAPAPFWPTNEASRWVLDQFTAQPGRRTGLSLPLTWREGARPELLALGLLYPSSEQAPNLSLLSRELANHGALLTGWSVLGQEVSALVKRDLVRVLIPMGVLLVASLWLAFRRALDVGLSLASLAASGLLLHAVMTVSGWTWNLMNLMALPLLLGMGVDFSIHILLALRRHAGDTRAVQGSVGRALLLAGSTTIAGFASLALASNAGIASLGQVCAAGIACSMLIAIGFLPAWWNALALAGERRRPHS